MKFYDKFWRIKSCFMESSYSISIYGCFNERNKNRFSSDCILEIVTNSISHIVFRCFLYSWYKIVIKPIVSQDKFVYIFILQPRRNSELSVVICAFSLALVNQLIYILSIRLANIIGRFMLSPNKWNKIKE
jgi:hypothetical protein